MVSESVRALKARFYPDHLDGTAIFHRLIGDRLREDARVLDLGCGKGRPQADLRPEAAFVVGCDISEEVRGNRFVSARVRGDAHELPFRPDSFDLVVLDYVLEHLKSPRRWAQEAFRVLKPGGRLIFRTPNLYHYVSVASRLTPHWVHELVADRARGLGRCDESGIFPTYYRANTRSAVRGICTRVGLVPEVLLMVEREPSYLMFGKLAFLCGYLYERTVNRYAWLDVFRSNIFGVFRKPAV